MKSLLFCFIIVYSSISFSLSKNECTLISYSTNIFSINFNEKSKKIVHNDSFGLLNYHFTIISSELETDSNYYMIRLSSIDSNPLGMGLYGVLGRYEKDKEYKKIDINNRLDSTMIYQCFLSKKNLFYISYVYTKNGIVYDLECYVPCEYYDYSNVEIHKILDSFKIK